MQTLTVGTCAGVLNIFTIEDKYARYRFVFARYLFCLCH